MNRRGESFLNGPGEPPWLRLNREYAEVRRTQASIWDHMP